eukprot:jgi/Chrzof1/5229/Cz15g18020.t1
MSGVLQQLKPQLPATSFKPPQKYHELVVDGLKFIFGVQANDGSAGDAAGPAANAAKSEQVPADLAAPLPGLTALVGLGTVRGIDSSGTTAEGTAADVSDAAAVPAG